MSTPLTQLLQRWSEGDRSAHEALIEEVYQKLKQIARAQLSGERPGHTLQPTALVNEAYLKLAGHENMEWHDRVHFFAVSARVIRQILIDDGRRRQSNKRRGQNVTLQTGLVSEDDDPVDLFELDQALDELARLDEKLARVVELRFFAGLSIAETAVAMDLSTATVERYWRTARAWLYSKLDGPHD